MPGKIRFVFDDRIVEIGFSGSSAYKPTTTVLDYLRSQPSHKGAKEGCAEGDCGACTVVLAEIGPNGNLFYKTIDSCLVFLPMIHGKQLITVENLAFYKENKKVLHPVQQMIVDQNGSQCGYCTPGIVMSLFGLYKNHRNPTREEVADTLSGNLCRCTGYQSIMDAAILACSGNGQDQFSLYEPVVAGMLNEINGENQSLELSSGRQCYFKPFTLREALRIRAAYPDAIVISGSTDVSLRQTKRKEILPVILDISGVRELQYCVGEEDRFRIGAGLSLERLKIFSKQRLPALHTLLKAFGSLQIRNMATLGGNIGSASPIGDTLPVLMAYKAIVKVMSVNGERYIGTDSLFAGYRKTTLENNELITEIVIPKSDLDTFFFAHKVSRRKDTDISTVSCGFRLSLEQGMVQEVILAYGGLAATPARALKTEQFLTGKNWSDKLVSQAMSLVDQDFNPISDARADAAYRKSVARNLLMKFYLEMKQPGHPDWVSHPHGVAHPNGVAHPDGVVEKHATGESVFIEDMPVNNQLLHGRVVYSKLAHARILEFNLSDALLVPGVHAILTAGDIPGKNQMGPVIHDEPCLAEHEVTFIGQAVALIAADSEEAAIEAEKKIRAEFSPLPAILNIKQAMAAGSMIATPPKILRGDPDTALKNSPHVIRGELATGAQEHWYLETQTALAIPGEGREMLIHASSQNPSETQAIVAEVLGIQKNEVEVEVRRMGGAFGGKETQGNHFAAWAALLAQATSRPVTIHLFRDDDQIMTGKRHRFLSNYEIGFDEHGMITAYKVELNSDAGSSTDLSRAILERAMLHADNAYYLPNVSVTGTAWKTNLPSNTAFRGFGGPQGMAVIENAIDRIARFLKKDPAEIRYLNFYRPGEHNLTPYSQVVEGDRLGTMFGKLIASSGYHQRRDEINRFNRDNVFFKKGMALTPVKFGISFTTAFLNQAGALVNIYTDGTVLVNHGGTEMGQGLHTKILRITAVELGVSPEFIRVNATNTSKVPNTSPTAASSGSDLNGMAVKNAIGTLKERLSALAVSELSELFPETDFKKENIEFSDNMVFDTSHTEHKIPFRDLCAQARIKQVSLSATGYYRTPGIYFNRETGQGKPFHYFAYGMAVSEVKIDTLTGAHQALRTDILHDVGDSINESTDMGQIEGGFVQGMGWCTTEEVKWDNEGNLLTHSPDTYKIPTIADIPADFRVELLKNVPNPGTIRGSKAVGEPPLMLGLSVWLAIKDAVSAVDDHETEPDFSLPATGEVILTAIEKIKRMTEPHD